MKRRDLEKHLRDHGCERVRHGGNHDIWENPRTNRETSLPRHREIKAGTARNICRRLGVPVPNVK